MIQVTLRIYKHVLYETNFSLKVTQKDFLLKYNSLISQYFTHEEDRFKTMKYYSEKYPIQMIEIKSKILFRRLKILII